MKQKRVKAWSCDEPPVARGRTESSWWGRNGRTRPLGTEKTMAWTTPTLVEICIGLEINGYLPAEF